MELCVAYNRFTVPIHQFLEYDDSFSLAKKMNRDFKVDTLYIKNNN